MQAKQPNAQKKRDLILSIVLFVVIGSAFLAFRLFAFNTEAAIAHVYYGASSEPIVTINFNTGQITKHRDQEGVDSDTVYPIIDEMNQTITLLGDYKVGGVRQIVVIQYNIEKRSVQIIEEQSPNNICSREGESTGWPLICLPNRIRVEFEASDEDFIV
jgi:hypothetical protein